MEACKNKWLVKLNYEWKSAYLRPISSVRLEMSSHLRQPPGWIDHALGKSFVSR